MNSDLESSRASSCARALCCSRVRVLLARGAARFDGRASTRRVLRGLLLVSLCGGLLALTPPGARAQDGAEDAVYKDLIEQALNEFKHKNWPEARALFTRAHERNPNARTQRGLGVVSYEMRDYVNAMVNLKAALDDSRQPLTDVQRKECEGLLARAQTYVGVFALKVEPQDAQVLLDGAPPSRNGEGHLLVPFGEHVISASAPGRQASSTRLNVQGGERGEIALVLPPEGTAPIVAGTPAATGTALPPAGQSSPGAAPSAGGAAAADGFGGHGLKYTWVALGASALFGGTAGLMWSLGQNELDDLDQTCRERADSADACTRDNTNTDQVKLYQNLTNASIGISAAALVTAAVLMGVEWPRERQLALGVGPGSLSLRGAF
jgi:hypothetical protein